MLFSCALVCLLASFGGVTLGISLKGLWVMKFGLEKAQKKMFLLGSVCVGLAILISLFSLTLQCSK